MPQRRIRRRVRSTRPCGPAVPVAPGARPTAAASPPGAPPAVVATAPAGPGPTIINAAPPPAAAPVASVPTGSLAIAPAFGPAVVKPAQPVGPLALQLGSAGSLDQLRQSWADLKARSGATLDGLTARYQVSGAAGDQQPFRLMVGPLSSSDDAKAACQRLAAQGMSCRVTSFGGNALE